MATGSLRFVDHGDWFDAALSALFLIIFPVVIIAVWLGVPEVAPAWAAAALTVGALVCIPFPLRDVVRARSRILTINPGERRIEATTRSPFALSREVWQFADVNAIVVRRSTSPEGDFHRGAVSLKDGREYVFVQGNHETGVRERAEELKSALRAGGFDPAIIIEGR